MTELLIQHNRINDTDNYTVLNPADLKLSGQHVEIPCPYTLHVEGRPKSNLMFDLQWYLEKFLEYPFDPDDETAERILDRLKSWGKDAFKTLFTTGEAVHWFRDAENKGLKNLSLVISSDDPRVLSYPWEALIHDGSGFLAQQCRIERRMNDVGTSHKLPEKLARDVINILLLIPRPLGSLDVKYRSLSHPLVDLIKKENLPAEINILRPPTFQNLIDHLDKRRGFYHILHFDGHGVFGGEPASGVLNIDRSRYEARGPEGHLVFINEKGEGVPVGAKDLADLIKEYAIPAVVMNACQSAMTNPSDDNPFASVAASLIRSGTPNVVAMAYSLWVSGAKQFIPAFYKRLFESGDFSEALRAGRRQMKIESGRTCARGSFPLEDWLVPVLYRNAPDPEAFSFVTTAKAKPPAREYILTEEKSDLDNPYGMVGRDAALLALEGGILSTAPAILVQGMGGIGKTTLARGFAEWLYDTNGLGNGCFWQAFNGVRSADYVFTSMGEKLFGSNFNILSTNQKIETLTGALRDNKFLIIWDNFESVCGIPGTEIKANLKEADRKLLKRFLMGLRGGKTKVIVTSRSQEMWLGDENLFELKIGGLWEEERWQLFDIIRQALGIEIDRKTKDIKDLMDALNGHPLSMRVIIPRLKNQSSSELLEAFQTNFEALELSSENEAENRLYATLKIGTDALPDELTELLISLGLHEKYFESYFLKHMASKVDKKWTADKVESFLNGLAGAGLINSAEGNMYSIHPALTGYLRANVLSNSEEETKQRWTREFVNAMASIADFLAPKKLHEKRGWFSYFEVNFHNTLNFAGEMEMIDYEAALIQSFASYYQDMRYLNEAEEYYTSYLQLKKKSEDEEGMAVAMHQLGMIAQERRDFDTVEKWYKKSLEIKEREGNEHGAALTYHQLGMIAQERRDFNSAEKWYKKSLDIDERHGNEHGAATTYHQLGYVAQECRDFDTAEEWYKKSLEIKERQGNGHGAAQTYGQLGNLSLSNHDLDSAEKWLMKALKLFEKLSDDHNMATTYHQLGRIAEERRDFDTAEKWYKKSLDIEERQGNEHGAAQTYLVLGVMYKEKGSLIESSGWLVKSVIGFSKANHQEAAVVVTQAIMSNYKEATPEDRQKIRQLCENAGLGDIPFDKIDEDKA